MIVFLFFVKGNSLGSLLFFGLTAQFFYWPKKLSPRDQIRHIAPETSGSAGNGGAACKFFIC